MLSDADALFRSFIRPVWVITAAASGRRGGLTATWVQPTSLDPTEPLLTVGLGPNHFTTELVLTSGVFNAQLLRRDQTDLALHFALGSGCDRDKLAAIAHVETPYGPRLADCLGWMSCRVVERIDLGDRWLLVADVMDAQRSSAEEPLYDRELFKAASPEQVEQLREAMRHDIELQRPLRVAWRALRSRPTF